MEPNYRCQQDELYEGCDLLATNLEEELASFTAFKGKYDPAFVATFRAQLAAAIAIPDDVQRSAAHETLRISMMNNVNTDMRARMGSLRLYIRDAYTNVDVRRVRLQEAGFDDYEQAMNYNWEKVKAFLRNANDFITNHMAELLAGNNMPVGFETIISNMKASADADITNLLNLRENAKQGSQAKVSANNALFDAAMDICGDGQHVFETNEAKKAQFVWISILELVSPPGAAGLRGDVKADGTNLPLAGANVFIQRKGGGIPLNLLTDAEGKVHFESLEVGDYGGKVTLTGYIDLDIAFEISTGVTSFKHWLLTINP